MQNLPAQKSFLDRFASFLKKQGVSKASLKYYRSDILHFSKWLNKKAFEKGLATESFLELTDLLDSKLAKQYKRYLLKSGLSVKTVNRKLSSLRQLASYLQSIKALDSNFMKRVTNITAKKRPSVHPAIKHFERHLVEQSVSKNTIKNYLVDVRQFIVWLEKQEMTNSSP